MHWRECTSKCEIYNLNTKINYEFVEAILEINCRFGNCRVFIVKFTGILLDF